ncbi:DegV family protein [Loigolactobacillus zhaoyuanensis]|uniref:DegV family protein n=1 Tax=Loigolactobacillus zhaoyuanensis TaxID=2486017 RepID=A0ABW8UHH2_9LACO|nr:DegV family protein [Loigolactobacillus zhaoyuanensis]
MKIAVVTDSASYLSPEQAATNDITVVPITVIFGQHAYKENIDITTKDFYEKLTSEKELPTTAQISMGQIQAVYDDLAAQGYEAVISIHLSSGITSFINNLEAYLPNITNIKVYPFDSKLTSAAEANQALLAAKLVQAGKSVDEIIAALTELRATQHVDFVVDDLSHLVRTGRLSNTSALLGNMLRIKPILRFNDAGQIIAVAKERTMRRAFSHIKADLESFIAAADYPVRIDVIDGDNQATSDEWIADLKQSFPEATVDASSLGPVIGVHTGRKMMGAVWSRDYQDIE